MIELTKQEAFEKAAKGLWKQKAYSTDPSGFCRYDYKGKRCAAGFLFPGDFNFNGFEGQSAGCFLSGPFPQLKIKDEDNINKAWRFLKALQGKIHDSPAKSTDGFVTEVFLINCRAFAKEQDLDTSFMKTW